jgi:hypothetical protein
VDIELQLGGHAPDVDVVPGVIAGVGADEVARGIAREKVQTATAHRVGVDVPKRAVHLQPEGMAQWQRIAAERERRLVTGVLAALDAERRVWVGYGWALRKGRCGHQKPPDQVCEAYAVHDVCLSGRQLSEDSTDPVHAGWWHSLP